MAKYRVKIDLIIESYGIEGARASIQNNLYQIPIEISEIEEKNIGGYNTIILNNL